MKIYIGFSKPIKDNPFAALIKWVEARQYDHAYVRLQEPMFKEYVIFQASGLAVNLFNTEHFVSRHSIIKEYEIEIDTDQYAMLWKFVISMLGIKYSLKSVFGILLMKVFHIRQILGDGDKSAFCSKLSAQVCAMLGIKLPDDPDSIDPSALDRMLEILNLPMKLDPKI